MRHRRRAVLSFCCAAACGLLSLPLEAQQSAAPNVPTYNVEVVIFRALGALGTAENWAAQTRGSTMSGEDDAPVSTADAGAARLTATVPGADFKLTEIESRLRASSAYQPI